MTARHYRESTVRTTARELKRVRDAMDAYAPIPPYCERTARRALTWLQACPDQDVKLRQYLESQGVRPITVVLTEKIPLRKREARSFEDKDWDRFRDALYLSDDPRDRVIEILCLTGLRIGDLLRTPTARIARGLELNEIPIERKGGAYVYIPVGVAEPWERLLEQLTARQCVNVASLLSSNPSALAGDASYQAVNRRLQYWRQTLGFKARVHTHKMRRTFAVRMYATTKDLLAVQQALNNGPAATMKYLDESRSATLAEHQRNLFNKRSGE